MTRRRELVLEVDSLARVEGEGALRVVVEHGRVTEVKLDIYEPPRFFEALLRGRSHTEPPDITARICGNCPVAYQISACRALEDACGVVVPERIDALLRLLYCGEWIESHALQIVQAIEEALTIVIEADPRRIAQSSLHLEDGHLTTHREEAIRDYDPCISCSARFSDLHRLDLDITRR